jgi:IclR family pca regulon transcriptional regulator
MPTQNVAKRSSCTAWDRGTHGTGGRTADRASTDLHDARRAQAKRVVFEGSVGQAVRTGGVGNRGRLPTPPSIPEVIEMPNDGTRGQSAKDPVRSAKTPVRHTGWQGATDSSWAPRVRTAPDPRQSRSLEYGVAILECFSRERHLLGIAELADILGISRSTTHRYAVTLVALGYLEQDSRRKYRLSSNAGGSGSAAIIAIRRQVPARATLEELRDDTGHTVSMGILDGPRVIYVHRLLGHRLGQHAIDRDLGVGVNVPVHCTALGKVLLASISDAERRELLAGLTLTRHGPNAITSKRKLVAELDSIVARDAVVSDEELISGARSIAALVPRPHGERPLAIEVTVPSSAYTVDRLVREIGPRLKRAARLISG